MDAIAAEAGVAVQTVYFAFRTKAELLLAALAEPDPRQALARLVDGVMAVLLRSGPLHPVMWTNPDEDIHHAFRHREQGRYENYRTVIHALIQHGGIRPGLDERTATDFNILCTTRQWPAGEFKTWVTASLEAQLLRPQRPQRPKKPPDAAPA